METVQSTKRDLMERQDRTRKTGYAGVAPIHQPLLELLAEGVDVGSEVLDAAAREAGRLWAARALLELDLSKVDDAGFFVEDGSVPLPKTNPRGPDVVKWEGGEHVDEVLEYGSQHVSARARHTLGIVLVPVVRSVHSPELTAKLKSVLAASGPSQYTPIMVERVADGHFDQLRAGGWEITEAHREDGAFAVCGVLPGLRDVAAHGPNPGEARRLWVTCAADERVLTPDELDRFYRYLLEPSKMLEIVRVVPLSESASESKESTDTIPDVPPLVTVFR